ncbi:C40 family peptidase [Sinomicrobium weinanense]|uniref:C40 family peptidase n=1 Tax=Sinomicrobium weinanense TaxID=2842200 RepID=A0A926Q5I5_9FLAO|nr:NlpC/P60 family protein [Sinomicrobium weinanense]MBC9798010.1 C40 family peptidase [Sinomicrobium weinanense]MBU3123607.1 C40 family peptidase [Sinomicrobium weinanense]
MTRRVLVGLWLVVLGVSCKSSQLGIIPITDEQVQIEFGELGDLEEEEKEPSEEEEEETMAIEAITDEDVQEELGGTGYTASTPPPPRTSPATTTTVAMPEEEPINAAILLEGGQVVLENEETAIELEEVEVVGIVHPTQYPLAPIEPEQLAFLGSHGAKSAPLLKEVKVRSYSPLTIEDKIFFAKQLKVKPLEIKDAQLYSYIKDRLGDQFQKGRLDHLTLMQNLYGKVYDVNFPRTASKAILRNYTEGKIHYTKDMKEGDLLFFRLTKSRRLYTHVGIYLQNKRFLTVTPSGGVEIASLKDRLWKGAYIGRGRVKNMKRR